jgi:catechol 2,3-dioxygenase-like lactoylglutathione lyase family enzyme
MEPIIDHIEITVRDMKTAVPFYDKLLPLLGFDVHSRVSAVMEQHDKHVVQYENPRLGFAITSPRRAFAAEMVNRRKPGGLARLLKTSPQLWMRLQADWELHQAMQRQARRAS